MSDDQMKKMLRAVLQSNKNGVSITRLQGDYRSLTGEFIPFKQLGYHSLEAFLRSIPSVVRMEYRMGEITCFAAVCQETAHIAQLVARQKSNKKAPGRSQMLNSKLQKSLRQPDRPPAHWGQPPRLRNNTYGGFSASGDIRKMYSHLDERVNSHAPAPQDLFRKPSSQATVQSVRSDRKLTHSSGVLNDINNNVSNKSAASAPPKPQASQPGCVYNPQVVQGLLTEVLKKFCSGVWLSKLSSVYWSMHNQEMPAQAFKDLENWAHICSVEKPGNSSRTDRLVFPALPKPLTSATPFSPHANSATVKHANTTKTKPGTTSAVNAITTTPVKLAPVLRSPPVSQNKTSPILPSWKQSPTSPATSATMCLPPSTPTSPPPNSKKHIPLPLTPNSPAAVDIPARVRLRLRELLSKYSQGLWAHALPKLYQDTFKEPFPENVLASLYLMPDICTVQFPMPDNKKKAILYGPAAEYKEKAISSSPRPSGCQLNSSPTVPPLVPPKEDFPSVLVVEASSTTQIILRYIGEGYSQAQEVMEESMRLVYSQPSAQKLLPFPSAGKLAAVNVEGGEEVVRAQVCKVMDDKVEVYYVDHGFSEVIMKTKLLELQKDFLQLPFQAATCTLAGLESFSSERSVLQTLKSLALGKILLVELLQHDAHVPQAVLYDTSRSEDINVNAACLEALQDKAMENPLQVNSTYMNVSFTNVCSDGTIYCQLPSRGQVKLKEVLKKIEAFFITQVTSECLVSTPFCGKCCLARYKGKWSRVQITNVHGSRVLDIQFVDMGVPASVEVIELREIPPAFLHELLVISPQVVKCRLADLSLEPWPAEAVLWLRDSVLPSTDCTMTISKLDDAKLVHVYLFTSNSSQNISNSINHQMANSSLWKRPAPRPQKDSLAASIPCLLDLMETKTVDQVTLNSTAYTDTENLSNTPICTLKSSDRVEQQLALPPLMGLPLAGQNMDIYVSVACHPGHFVLQPWQDLYKLVVLMGEMVLYYNQSEMQGPLDVRKGEVYAAKVENNWHRVVVKGILANGLVSVYQLDYGRHELVGISQIQPLIESFRQLPFQGIKAQLAGVKQRMWSEEVAILFRNHVEKKALVAQVVEMVEAELPWDRKVVVYLVDTAQQDRDIWIHNIMADFTEELGTRA